MSKNIVTIKDVAQYAGVSIAAVSYVLNNKEHKVSDEKIELIHEAIKKLNYIPNMSARSLAKNTSKLIAVIIPQTEKQSQLVFQNPFYSEMISNIEAEVRKEGYNIILAGIEKGQSYQDISVSRNLDGIILIGAYPDELYEEGKKIDIPIVFVDSYINDDFFTTIGIDDEYGGYLATKYLIENGHQHIAIVTGSIRKDGVVEKRYTGYKRALAEFSIPYRKEYVFGESVSFEHGHDTGCLIASDYKKITAAFATADVIAFGLIRGLIENNTSVPQDVSVIGFDDITFSSMFFPPLTTINQNIPLKGALAAKLLLNKINDNNHPTESTTTIPLNVIERQTVVKLNA